MSTTANNNQEASSSSSSASINSNTSKERLDSLEEKFDNLFSLVNRLMKHSMNSSNNSSEPSCKRVDDDSDTEDKIREKFDDTDSVPTHYPLSDTLLDKYKLLINNQGLLVEEERNHCFVNSQASFGRVRRNNISKEVCGGVTKEVQDLLVGVAIEQVLPNQYSKLVFNSKVFTVP
ncbi:hypothetical protein ACTFIU_009023 [Dictyostelium citrinum]